MGVEPWKLAKEARIWMSWAIEAERAEMEALHYKPTLYRDEYTPVLDMSTVDTSGAGTSFNW